MDVEWRAPPSLSIPPWFPPYLEETARLLHRQHAGAEGAAIVKRLVADDRMHKVWRELERRNSDKRQIDGGPKFMHQAIVSPGLLDELPLDKLADGRCHQQIAIRRFFQYIVDEALRARPIPKLELGGFDRGRFQNEAVSLRADTRILHNRADEILRLSETSSGTVRAHREQQIDKLVGAIAVLEELAREIDGETANEKIVKDFMVCVGTRARLLFGTALVGTTATITTVAFKRKITSDAVREIFRSSGWFLAAKPKPRNAKVSPA
jgi:hypothetical protein